jgi:hypothetical protein
MAELILSSESDYDEEMDTLMVLYQTSKRQQSVWKNEYMKKRKTDGEFGLPSEFSDKQFTDCVRLNRRQFNEVHRLVKNSVYADGFITITVTYYYLLPYYYSLLLMWDQWRDCDGSIFSSSVGRKVEQTHFTSSATSITA